MKSFLDQLAAEVLKDGKTDFSNLCIVLPNRRAGVFLRDALSKAGDRAIWAPKILSIEDFIFQLSGYIKVDQITLLFSFYEVYKKHVSEPQPLEMFANWATTFLSDINEVDINLVDAEDIFNQLTSVERIAKWNPDGSEITELQQKHLKFVESFSGLYSAVKTQLDSENKAYQGMAFRKVAEHAESLLKSCEWDKVWFAGFNALTVSEEAIIQVFQENEKARLFWDMDSFYANDPIHEAGFYIRKYQQGRGQLKLDSEINWNQNYFTNEPKEIHVIAAQRSVAQAEAAASILSKKLENSQSDTLSNTAVILNDEKVLVPLLSSLPTQLTGVNITMGYGLRYSQSVVFIDKIFQLYSSITEGAFYHKHLMSVLSDGIYLSVAKVDVSEVKKRLIKQKKAYLSKEDLADAEFDKLLFGLNDVSVPSFLEHLKKVVCFIRNQWAGSSHVLELKFLSLLERMLVRLSDLQGEFGGVDSLKTLQVFWRQLTNNQSLDFVGEPIGGLQIMGMLETRNLDFEELIILGVNEGSLPSNAHTPSNFTFDVRRVFGLACQNERDAVTAYHFYRLIQRAKKVYLVYDQDTTSFGGGEVSRYVQQLQNEKPTNISIKTWGVEQKLPKSELAHEISILKGKEELDKLNMLGQRGFSPSALNTYRSCSLKFYFRYVADFKEENKLNEDVDYATFGTAVHDTLDVLYQPTVGKPLAEKDLVQMTKEMEPELTRQFANQVSASKLNHGKNLLAYEVAKTYVKRVLDYDLRAVKAGKTVTPKELEGELCANLSVKSGDKTYDVRIKGIADRIDQLSDGTVRVIDYKTGSFDKTTIIKNETALEANKADNAFQLLMYGLMYKAENPSQNEIQPTVFFLRAKEIESPIGVVLEKQELSSEEQVEFTKSKVTEVLSEMFDQELHFEQTEKTDNCAYCDFKHVCQR